VHQCRPLRGIARGGEDSAPDAGFVELTRDGLMVITLEPDGSGERYQGVVPLEGAHLGEALEGYFAQSEQLPTRVLLAADEHVAAGLLLQRLPGEGGHGAVDPDGWNRAEHLAATVAPAELLSCDPELLLHRLFHDVPRVDADVLPLYPRCRCSREKVTDVLRRIGREESLAAVQQTGEALVTCEFCGRTYRFDRIDIESLFLPQPPAEGGPASLQ
jgi:molecular chaperone Hsp33